LPHAKFEAPDVEPYEGKPWPPGHKTYAAMITRADRHIGQLLQLLKELNLESNTVVVITSDNGAHKGDEKGFEFFRSNGALRGEKGELYEGGIRVPFIAKWPGRIKAGSTSSYVTAFCDVLPTLADIAGAPRPRNLDGISILPELTGGKQRAHAYLYWEHNIYDQKSGTLQADRLSQAVRMGDLKAVRPRPGAPIEIYDLRNDAAETTDLAPKEPALVRRMEQLFKTARTEPRPHNTGSMRWVP
jgi:arylsulfatase A